jgi:hypothetical protein
MNADPKQSKGELARAGQSDYHTVLMRVIQSTTQDPQQLRNLVYELARIKLRRETWLQEPALSADDAKDHLLALEAAIADVEAITAQDDTDPIQRSSSNELMPISIERRPDGEITIIDPPSEQRFRQYDRIALVSDLAPDRSKFWILSARFLQLAGVAVLGVIIYVIVAGRTDLIDQLTGRGSEGKADRLAMQAPVQAPSVIAPIAAPPPPYPLPTSYGLYALNGNQLQQLEVLPMRAPDERVLIGPVVNKPSATVVPDGKVAFILFRRDLAGASDRVPVRIMARIARAVTFENAKAVTRPVDSSWAMRGKAVEFRVGPIPENPQMLMIKPDSEDYTLTPGRYALILKNEAFDFAVDGPVTDIEHCLERFDAANGGVYAPCSPPSNVPSQPAPANTRKR